MWMNRAQYCPVCAAPLSEALVDGRPRRRCSACTFVLYQNPASAAAGVILDRDHRVLLVRRAIEPFRGHWALPAGYQEIEEHPTETVRREVEEETGLVVEAYRLIDLIFVPDDPRRPANLAVYLCRVLGGRLSASDDAEAAEWFPLDGLPDPIGFGNRERILDPLLLDPTRFGLPRSGHRPELP
jgi:ADP-ribose pyrophosphatase YjhB (NUDIX family)